MVRQYIGARYVPKFYESSLGTSAWEAGVIYEPLTIVTYNGNSYTSKKPVPSNIGNPSAHPEYWVATGVFNEQLAEIQQRLNDIESDYVVGVPSYVSGATAANSVLYIAHAEHAFLFDMGHYYSFSETVRALKAANVKYIDGVVITHYHGDHDGNPFSEGQDYSHWAREFDFTGCSFYLPNDPPANITAWDETTEPKLRATFTQCPFYKPPFSNITWNGYTITLLNGDAAAYNWYSTRTDNYNNYSLVAFISGHGADILYTSDISLIGQQYLYDNNYLRAVDVMTMPHHGVNGEGDTNFALRCSPEKVVVIDGPVASTAYSDPIFKILEEVVGTEFISTRRSYPNDIKGTATYGVYMSGSSMRGGWYGGALGAMPAIYFDATYTRNDGDGSKNNPINNVQRLMTSLHGYTRVVLHSDCPYMTLMDGGFVYIQGEGHSIAGADFARNSHVIVDNAVFTAEIAVNAGATLYAMNGSSPGIRPIHSTLHLANWTLTNAIAPFHSVVIGEGVKETGNVSYLVYGKNSVISLDFDLSNISATASGIIYNPGGTTSTPYDDGPAADFVKVYDGYTKRYGYERSTNRPFVIYGGAAHYLAVT